VGALLAFSAGVIYFAARPPLFDNDGYRDHIYGIQPHWYYNFNPHHLAWIPIQALIGKVSGVLGYSSTVPFQVVGIMVACVTLLLFFLLLSRTCGNTIFAIGATVFCAFSPQFWRLNLEDRPYALVFLGLTLYLLVWRTTDGAAPGGWRLLEAGLLALMLVMLQQAMAVIVPAATLVLIASGRGSRAQRWIRALAWAASVLALVLLIYLTAWQTSSADTDSFFGWTTKFASILHNPSLYDLGFTMCLLKSVMGISGVLLEPTPIKNYLGTNYSPRFIFAVYGSVGTLAAGIAVASIWRERLDRIARRLASENALFAMSLLFMLGWSLFVFVWQPAEPHFWSVTLIPAAFCLGLVMRERAWAGLRVFLVIVTFATVWNAYFNHVSDRSLSHNFPEPLLASIRQHLGPRDIFVILDSDSTEMDYDLLFECLHYSHNPGIMIADYVNAPDQSKAPWQERFRDRIESTIRSGRKVYVAAHVLDRDSYADLTGQDNPFAIAIYKSSPTIPGPVIYQGVHEVLEPYRAVPSDFWIGFEQYFLLEPARRGR
jgi:hypothetical protein